MSPARRRRAVAAIAAAAVMVGAAPAAAGTVSVELIDRALPPGVTPRGAVDLALVYRSDPGETDAVRLFDDLDWGLVVAAPGIRAGEGCRAEEPGIVCDMSGVDVLVALLGDGDDALTIDPGAPALGSYVAGDAGNDRIAGGGGDDTFSGGEGDDTLLGGAGDDQLQGDAGNDVVDGGPDDDFLSGGDGDDVLRAGTGVNILSDEGAGNDTFECGSAFDILRGSAGARLVDCEPPDVGRIGTVRRWWKVYTGGYTVPDVLQMRFRLPSGYGYRGLSPTAGLRGYIRCLGCHGMRFRYRRVVQGAEMMLKFSRRSGGVRVPGTRRYALRPGARVVIGLTSGAGFTKEQVFTIRRAALPARRLRCLAPSGRVIACA